MCVSAIVRYYILQITYICTYKGALIHKNTYNNVSTVGSIMGVSTVQYSAVRTCVDVSIAVVWSLLHRWFGSRGV